MIGLTERVLCDDSWRTVSLLACFFPLLPLPVTRIYNDHCIINFLFVFFQIMTMHARRWVWRCSRRGVRRGGSGTTAPAASPLMPFFISPRRLCIPYIIEEKHSVRLCVLSSKHKEMGGRSISIHSLTYRTPTLICGTERQEDEEEEDDEDADIGRRTGIEEELMGEGPLGLVEGSNLMCCCWCS